MEALVIAIAPAAVFAGHIRQPLKVSNGYRPVLGSLVGLLCRAKMALPLSWRGVAVEVGLLSAVATGRGPGCHAANMSRAIRVVYLRGLLNSRLGSAIQHATVVFGGCVAWLRASDAIGAASSQSLRTGWCFGVSE
jgi:hypothetical protein